MYLKGGKKLQQTWARQSWIFSFWLKVEREQPDVNWAQNKLNKAWQHIIQRRFDKLACFTLNW